MSGSNGSNGNGNGNGAAAAAAAAGGTAVFPPGHDADGRIPDIDAALRKAFFDVLAETGNVRLACRTVGIHHSTFYRWKKEGERLGRGRYYSFAQAADRGMAEWERRQVARITRAAAPTTELEEWDETWRSKKDGVEGSKTVRKKKRKRGDWGAAAWLLERRFPERYGRRQHVDVEGKLSLVDVLTDLRDEKEARAGRLAATSSRRLEDDEAGE